MSEPPAPNSDEARRICRAFANQACITLEWNGKPSFWCYSHARSRWNDIASIERWDGDEENV